MPSLRLVLEPDPRLHSPSCQVVSFDPGLAALADGMIECMLAAKGVGLAAVQVGRPERMFVADFSGSLSVFLNPELISRGAWFTATEGCLSIPGRTFHPPRPTSVVLRWQDLAGQTHQDVFTGLAAHIIAHEVDHLDGILAPDRCAIGPG